MRLKPPAERHEVRACPRAVTIKAESNGSRLKASNSPMQRKPYNVLFLCTGNSARSIMAEAILNRVGGGKFHAYSAGSYPTGKVNPHALELLKRQNYRVSDLRSKNWDEFAQDDGPTMDFVITVCDKAADEVCPVWPGQPVTAHWGLVDPAAAQGSEAEIRRAFTDVYKELTRRLETLASLPMAQLDRLALEKRIRAMGGRGDSAA